MMLQSKRVDVLAFGILVLAGVVCWWQYRALTSIRDVHDTAHRQVGQMRSDAAGIRRLRNAPRSAVSRTRENEELIAQVEQAITAANIDRSRWQETIPMPAQRIDNGDYKRQTTRISLRDIELRQLATFAHALETRDPTLRVSGVNVSNRSPESPFYDVELTVSYLVYGPKLHLERRI